MAIVHALLLGTLIAAMAAGVATLAQLELRVAIHHRATLEARYVARGGAAFAMHELRDMADWSVALSGASPAAFTSPLPPGADVVCCASDTLTGRVRAATGRPWTPFGWSPAARLAGASDSRLYVVVWLADDPGDGDGDTAADSNSVVSMHIEAHREDGLTIAAEADVERVPVGGLYLMYPPSTIGSTISGATSVRLRSWRELTQSP
jgi:hypothetical protein